MNIKRLLVVEDVQNIADMICNAAYDVGFNSCSANGANAMMMYDSFQPDIIVLDLMISGLAEFEFIQFLKERQCKASIIILSGCSDAYRQIAENLAISSRLFIEANIAKPFRLNELRSILKKAQDSLADVDARPFQHIA
jgi:two-component system OmpR family response regulator